MNHYETLSAATNDLRKRGYTVEFKQKGAHLEGTHQESISLKPEDFEIVEVHRFEGVSNPSDMSVVYALKSKYGHKGILVDAYGVYSEAYSSEMLQKLKTSYRE